MAKKLQPKNKNHELWDDVRTALQSTADPALADQYKTIAPTSGTVLGIRVPNIRAMVKEFAASNKHLAAADAVAMADVAFASDCREEMLFATFFLGRFKSKLEAAHWNLWTAGSSASTTGKPAINLRWELPAKCSAARRNRSKKCGSGI